MISLRSFTGEFPRIPADKLPDNAAQYANNCDFSHGELRPLKGVTPLAPFGTAPQTVLGLYTEDGNTFLTWPEDVNAVKGPVLDDIFLRVYYTTTTDFRVTVRTAATAFNGLLTGGGPPVSSWKVGVPKPTGTPTVAVANAASFPDNITITWKFFYEANGTRYQEQVITPDTVTMGREYTFTAPQIRVLDEATDTSVPPITDTIVSETANAFKGTPDNAIPVVEIKGTFPSGTQAFKVWSSNSTFAANNETEGFNGLTVTLSASELSGVTTVKFDYGKGFQQTRAFVYTVVNIWNEESAPSLPLTVTYDIMQVPTLTLPQVVDPVTSPYQVVSAFRVYGSVSANSGATDYQMVGEVSSNGVQVNYAINSQSSTWTTLLGTIGHLPPSAALKGLVSVHNGMLAAFKGNEVWFCESYKPWAWNPENMIPLPFGVKGIVMSGASLVVTTTANPYIINGTLPESMGEERLLAIQGGVSKNGMTDCGGFAVYVSNDGLVTVQGGQADLSMGQRFFTREDWRTRYNAAALATMRLAFHDGCLVGYGVGVAGFLIRFDEATGSYTQYNYLANIAAAFMLPQTDSLYIASGATISEFRTGSAVTLFWKSKEFIAPRPTNYGAVQIVGSGSQEIFVFADGVPILDAAFTGSTTLRLPEGYKARKFEVWFLGTGTIKECYLAPTMRALKNV